MLERVPGLFALGNGEPRKVGGQVSNMMNKENGETKVTGGPSYVVNCEHLSQLLCFCG